MEVTVAAISSGSTTIGLDVQTQPRQASDIPSHRLHYQQHTQSNARAQHAFRCWPSTVLVATDAGRRVNGFQSSTRSDCSGVVSSVRENRCRIAPCLTRYVQESTSQGIHHGRSETDRRPTLFQVHLEHEQYQMREREKSISYFSSFSAQQAGQARRGASSKPR